MTWTKTPLRDPLVALLTAARFPDGDATGEIRSILVADGHAIATWTDYPRHFDWWRQEDSGWTLIDSYTTATGAKAVAEEWVLAQELTQAAPPAAGMTVVTAQWGPATRPMVVPCSSPKIAEEIAGIFRRMECPVDVTMS